MKIRKYIKNSCFVRSFKELDKRLLGVMALEILLMLSIFIIFLLSSVFLKTSLNNLGISDEFMNDIKQNYNNQTFAMSFLQGQMKYTSPEKFQSFLTKLGLNTFFSLTAIVLLISFFKSLEWSKIEKKKLTKLFFRRYLGLFLIWNISWMLLFFIVALGFQSYTIKYVVAIWFVSFTYFSFLLYPMFVKEKKVFNAIKKTLILGLINLYKLILPIINIWILLQLGYLIVILFSKIPLLAASFAFLYLLSYIAWIKFYMHLVIKNVKE